MIVWIFREEYVIDRSMNYTVLQRIFSVKHFSYSFYSNKKFEELFMTFLFEENHRKIYFFEALFVFFFFVFTISMLMFQTINFCVECQPGIIRHPLEQKRIIIYNLFTSTVYFPKFLCLFYICLAEFQVGLFIVVLNP